MKLACGISDYNTSDYEHRNITAIFKNGLANILAQKKPLLISFCLGKKLVVNNIIGLIVIKQQGRINKLKKNMLINISLKLHFNLLYTPQQ